MDDIRDHCNYHSNNIPVKHYLGQSDYYNKKNTKFYMSTWII